MHPLDKMNKILQDHHRYRESSLNLIAAEIPVSPTVRRFLTAELNARYGNYMDDPKERGYKGNKYIIELEAEVHKLAKELFHAEYTDLRALGGQSATAGVIMAFTEPGDTVFETGGYYGGQQVCNGFVNVPHAPKLAKGILNVVFWPYDSKTHQIDVNKAEKMIKEKKPSLLIMGRAQILFSPEPVKEIKEIAEEVGACLHYDGAHVLGLMAGKRFFNPLDDGADVLTGGHTKTFPGPQGGIVLTNSEEIYTKLQGGKGGRFNQPIVCNYHMARVAALGAALVEMKEFGEAYADQVLRNSAALGKAMFDLGFNVLYPEYGFSRSHMIMVDVLKFGGGTKNMNLLEKANIFCSRQSTYLDLERKTRASALRVGTQEITRTGMKEKDMSEIAQFFKRVIMDKEDVEVVAKDVAKFVSNFNKLTFTFDDGANPYKWGPV